jgi:hypothetical protein
VIHNGQVSVSQEPAAVEIIQQLMDSFDPNEYDYYPNVDMMIADYLLTEIKGEIIEMDPIPDDPEVIY